MNLADRILDVFSIDPQAAALEYGGVWRSWAEVAGACARINDVLGAAGVPRHAPVGVLVRNRPAHVAAYLALIVSGRTIVTLNPMQPAELVAREIRSLRLMAVLAEADDWGEEMKA